MDYDYDQLPFFSEGNIKILYRDQIKVFYPRVREAEAQGYDEYNPRVFSNKNGYLYSFTGLRGDAKKLYKACTTTSDYNKVHIQEPSAVYCNSLQFILNPNGFQILTHDDFYLSTPIASEI